MVRDCDSKEYLPKSFVLENFYDQMELKKLLVKTKFTF